MKPTIQLQIPKPCHENWNNMHATEQGRFCLSCQKEVIDFSLMTDREILKYISGTQNQACGRFGNEQLNRNLIVTAEPRKIWWKYWLSVAASLIVLSTKAGAQIKFKQQPIVCTDSNYRDQIVVGKIQATQETNVNKVKYEYIVSGMISDEDNRPIAGASIIVKNSRKGTVTEQNGRFKLKLSGFQNETLIVSAIGFEKQEIAVKQNADSNIVINLSMRTSVMGLGEVVVVKRKRKILKNFFKSGAAMCVKNVPDVVLKVYPNPVYSGSDIKIQTHGIRTGDYTLSITDLAGNLVLRKEINLISEKMFEELNCDQRFKTGMYVLQIIGNGKAISSKFIVQ